MYPSIHKGHAASAVLVVRWRPPFCVDSVAGFGVGDGPQVHASCSAPGRLDDRKRQGPGHGTYTLATPSTFTSRTESDRQNFAAGTRTRVWGVRIPYPNRLDYSEHGCMMPTLNSANNTTQGPNVERAVRTRRRQRSPMLQQVMGQGLPAFWGSSCPGLAWRAVRLLFVRVTQMLAAAGVWNEVNACMANITRRARVQCGCLHRSGELLMDRTND